MAGKKMAAFISLCVVIFISGDHELIEWGATVGADEFLGTQGDRWNTLSDMPMALIGGSVALVGLAGIQDRLIPRTIHKKLESIGICSAEGSGRRNAPK